MGGRKWGVKFGIGMTRSVKESGFWILREGGYKEGKQLDYRPPYSTHFTHSKKKFLRMPPNRAGSTVLFGNISTV
jgi:hypothetical protein